MDFLPTISSTLGDAVGLPLSIHSQDYISTPVEDGLRVAPAS